MERLRVNIVVDIVYRLRGGQSVRAIARDLRHSRKTIRRYQHLAQEKGYLDTSRALAEPGEVMAALGKGVSPPKQPSTVEPYRSVVEGLLEQGVEMVAIHNRLVKHHQYSGSYSSVRRFVHGIQPEETEVVVRIETAPGQEGQVDFGSAGMMRDLVTGEERLAYCFVMTLSYSRHEYVEFVFDQRMETWIGCHRSAFESFGGVPRELVIDNLKAAVIRASLDDPVLCEPYRKMAQHYGIIIHPCRVRTPEHKGKVESGVHYVQRNFLAGEKFLSREEANARVKEWIVECAGVRDHGTTHEPPLLRFYEREQKALLPLPQERFELMEVRQVKVHRDCHVEIGGSYYSAPYTYVGKRLDAYIWERTVQLYDGVELIVTHARAKGRGERITREGDYPAEKSVYLLLTRGYCQQRAAMIGACCAKVVGELLSERPLDRLRSVQGIIGLAEKYGESRVEAACARALHYGDPGYQRIKSILAAGLDSHALVAEPAQREFRFYEYARPMAEFFGGEVEAARC